MNNENKGFFRNLLDKYNELCKELGVDQGACRGCVPVVKFDPEQDDKSGEKTKDV
ncbi:DUF5363 domain-containing protein [Glaesserella parasuis]|uniref:DUF5363 domain-containing protein n=1 Tax=Glaesserella parasuis TaxID=738 RepID=UPI002437398C|nr:DUF5363 domain-containing protein [Glaesserella parasuis]MDG6784405.1 DUF5363 domain-containing protein [Glaesserella parasuis]MDP0254572.1 DUF5363 domain-containing protein [Glaesserella parasuis]